MVAPRFRTDVSRNSTAARAPARANFAGCSDGAQPDCRSEGRNCIASTFGFASPVFFSAVKRAIMLLRTIVLVRLPMLLAMFIRGGCAYGLGLVKGSAVSTEQHRLFKILLRIIAAAMIGSGSLFLSDLSAQEVSPRSNVAPDTEASPADSLYAGSLSCASAACHGRTAPRFGRADHSREEWTLWMQKDPHARARYLLDLSLIHI